MKYPQVIEVIKLTCNRVKLTLDRPIFTKGSRLQHDYRSQFDFIVESVEDDVYVLKYISTTRDCIPDNIFSPGLILMLIKSPEDNEVPIS